MKRIAILANGPGEFWGWGRPVVREMAKAGHPVDFYLLPCQFASGAEAKIAAFLGADRVVPPDAFWKSLAARAECGPDAVLQLGGDLLYGRAMAARYGIPLFSYSYGPKKGLEACRGIFTAFESMAGGMSLRGGEPVLAIGDLVADALLLDEGKSPWGKDGLRVALFPGSRPAIRKRALPFMTEFLDVAAKLLPEAQWCALLFPFCEPGEAALWERAGFVPALSGTGVVLAEADIALTQPGTNTLELLHAGVPAVVALPDEFLAEVPSPTFLAPLFALPGLGPALKRRAFHRYLEKREFLSWPNRLSKRAVFPEITGKISPESLARSFAAYASNGEWLEESRKALEKIDKGLANAARNLRERIAEILE